jgi:tetratricopeptide (TPR) repeat protein
MSRAGEHLDGELMPARAAERPAGGVADAYARCRVEGIAATLRGDLAAAEELLTRALDLARQLEDPSLADRAYCNLAAVQIERSPRDEILPRLRQILVRHADVETYRLAAYHLARAYELRKDCKKGLFYARIALEQTRHLAHPDPEWMASSHHQIGNLLVGESFFGDAIASYEQALAALPADGPDLRAAVIEINVGYCRVMLGQAQAGVRLLTRGLRVLRRRRQLQREQMQAHLDLALGYLELGRFRPVLRHATAALVLAEELGATDATKNALFLLGEGASLSGDEDTARGYFEKLQRFFPDTPFLPDLLLAIDVRKLINLRA